MRIVVALKQIFDPQAVRVNSRGDVVTQDAPRIINPADLCALEIALTAHEQSGAEVIALSVGDAEVDDALYEALAMGAQRAIRLDDPAFAGCDAHGVAYILSRAVETLGDVDLLLCGARSADEGAGQVGPETAAMLGWPQISEALQVEIAGDRVAGLEEMEDGSRQASVPLPAVVTVAEQANTPRLAAAAEIISVYRTKAVEVWGAEAVGAAAERLGPENAAAVLRGAVAAETAPRGDLLSGTPDAAARALVERLRRRGLI